MIKIRYSLTFLLILSVVGVLAQGRENYEFMRNLPVYADSLIADLTYPLAWGARKCTTVCSPRRLHLLTATT